MKSPKTLNKVIFKKWKVSQIFDSVILKESEEFHKYLTVQLTEN